MAFNYYYYSLGFPNHFPKFHALTSCCKTTITNKQNSEKPVLLETQNVSGGNCYLKGLETESPEENRCQLDREWPGSLPCTQGQVTLLSLLFQASASENGKSVWLQGQPIKLTKTLLEYWETIAHKEESARPVKCRATDRGA